MQKVERVATQRSLAREAIGKLRAVEEWFGVEDDRTISEDYATWRAKVDEFEWWLRNDSPIA